MILLMGPTGSGKSTQGQLLAKKRGLVWVSVGQLLRGHLEGADKRRYEQGELVSTNLAMKLFDEFLARVSANKQIMADGAPRNEKQLEALDELLAKHGRQLDTVIYISIPQTEIRKRLHARSRVDDLAVERKLAIFQAVTLPVVEIYKKRGLVKEIDGVGTVEEVSTRIEEVLDELN